MAFGAQPRSAEPGVRRTGWILRLPYPIRNLTRRWRSLVGMVLGVGIALGLSMAMLATSNATMELMTGDYLTSSADLYVITQGGTMVPLLAGEGPGTITHARGRLAQIRSLPGVSSAIGVMTWPLDRERDGPRRRNDPTELISTVGVDGDPTLIPNALVMSEGRWLQRTDEIVLGTRLGREKSLPIGSRIRLSGRDFQVVGIGRLRGLGWSSNALAYVDLRALRQRAEIGDVVNMIIVDTTQPDATRQQIARLESLAVYDIADVVHEAEEASAADLVTNWIFIGLSLAIAGLFVSSMLGRSVATRRLEFATLRAIGISSRTILLTVAGEAILICLLASFVGIGVSSALGVLIDGYVAPAYGFESFYSADAGLFAFVFVLALGLGLVAGLSPARQATRVDPVDVLREA